jgi:hypothetical protein
MIKLTSKQLDKISRSDIVEENLIDYERRWTDIFEIIFIRNGEYYRVYQEVGKTENAEVPVEDSYLYCNYNDGPYIYCHKVKKVEVIRHEWEDDE